MFTLLFTIVATTALGILAKVQAEALLREPYILFHPVFRLQLVENPGVAFGLNLGVFQNVLIGLALALFMWFAYVRIHHLASQIGFGLIIGGALGNILDRFGDGVVTDYVRIASFPVFNLPDAFITVGVVLLLLEELFWKKREY